MPPSNDDLRSWAALDGKRLMNVLSYRATLAELLAVVKAHRENGEEMRGRVGGGVREDRRGEERWGEGKEGGEGREEESVGEGKVGEGGGGEDRGEEGNVSSKRVKGQKDGKASTGLSPVHICTAFHRIAKHAKRMGGGRRLVDRLKEDETVRWLGRQVEALAKGGRLKGQALANVAWAQAELGHGPPSLLNTVMAASLAQIKSFQPLEVAILMHALGSTAGLPAVNASLARDLLGRLTWEHVIGSLHCYQPRHVKEILWAHARVGLHSHLLFCTHTRSFFPALSPALSPPPLHPLSTPSPPPPHLLPTTSPDGIIIPGHTRGMARSFAKLHHSDDSLFRALAAWAESNVPAFASQDISNMLCGVLSPPSGEWRPFSPLCGVLSPPSGEWRPFSPLCGVLSPPSGEWRPFSPLWAFVRLNVNAPSVFALFVPRGLCHSRASQASAARDSGGGEHEGLCHSRASQASAARGREESTRAYATAAGRQNQLLLKAVVEESTRQIVSAPHLTTQLVPPFPHPVLPTGAAYVTAGHRNQQLLEGAVGEESTRRMDHHTPFSSPIPSFSLAFAPPPIRAYATAGHRSQQLLEALGEESTRRIVGGTLEREAVSGQAVANIAWYEGVGAESIRQFVGSKLEREAVSGQAVANIAWYSAVLALATQSHYDVLFLKKSYHSLIPFSTALATQSHYDVPFFSAAAAHATRYIPRYAGRTIACLAFAFALIGHTAPPLFLRVESEVGGGFSPALGGCGLVPCLSLLLYWSIIRRLSLRSGEQEFGRQALVMLAWALVVHGQTDTPSAAPAPPAAAAPSAAAPSTSITTINSPSSLPSSPSSSASLSPALPILRHHLLSLTTDLTSSELCQLYQVDLATQLEAPEHSTRLVEGGMGVNLATQLEAPEHSTRLVAGGMGGMGQAGRSTKAPEHNTRLVEGGMGAMRDGREVDLATQLEAPEHNTRLVDLATQLEAPEHNTHLVEGGMGVMGHAPRSTSSSGSEGDGEWREQEQGQQQGQLEQGEQQQQQEEEEEEEMDESYWYLQHLWLSGFVRQQAKACWEAAHKAEKLQVSGLQRDISCALHQMHLPHTLEYRDGDYSIDLALLLPLAATESTGSDSTRSDYRRMERRVLKIAVEADGPSHFTISTSGMTTEQQHQQHSQQHPHQHNQQQQHVPLGPTRLKARLLRCRGWQVVQIPFFEWECLSDLHQKQTYLAARLGPLAMQLARAAAAADADVALEQAGGTGEGRTAERRIEEGGCGEGRTGEGRTGEGRTGEGKTGEGRTREDETGLSDKQQEEVGLKEGRVAEEAEQVGGGEFKPRDGEGKEVDEKVKEGEEGAQRREGGDVIPEKSQKEGEEEDEERRKGGDVLKRAEVLGAWKAGQGKGGLGADRLALLRKAAVRRGLTQK
ncbi:unnamed protein product [Closterium sp. NIES-64]|nr:unnamed protein product [Closterium sp. NIES-64]